WEALAEAGARLVGLDPLGEKSGLIAARALLEIGDREAAAAAVERVDSALVFVDELQMRPIETATRVQGTVIGNAAEPGTPVSLRFSFYEDARLLGTESIVVSAPAEGETTTFEVQFGARANGYRYAVEALGEISGGR